MASPADSDLWLVGHDILAAPGIGRAGELGRELPERVKPEFGGTAISCRTHSSV